MAGLADIKTLLKLHRAQLQGIVERRGVGRLVKLYTQARNELHTKLNSVAVRHGGGTTFSAHYLRLMLIQVEDTLREFGRRFPELLAENGALAQALGARHVVRETQKMHKVFTGTTPVLQTAQVGVLRGIVEGAQPSLLRRYERSVQFYTPPTIHHIEDQLALSLAQGETIDNAVDRVAATDGVFQGQRWRAERIVRTEGAYSYGVTKQLTMQSLRDRDVPRMQKKLIATFDDRTGEDSKELHGQVVDVDKPFIWEEKTKFGVRRHEYMQPPNRPNDREVVVPWMASWDETSWSEEGGRGPGAVTPTVPAVEPLERLAP